MPGDGVKRRKRRLGEESMKPMPALTTSASAAAPTEMSRPRVPAHAVDADALAVQEVPLPAPARVLPLSERQVQGQAWEPWLDEVAMAKFFCVSTRTVRRWQHAGMPSEKYGGLRRYRLSACEGWLRRGPGEERSA